ncbi:MAG: protease complex subunit PrcB family protein [Elusimicrobia bacterium]|nr:protease complex subunit PrcB family protein [Elusimicrobiota bacterium]MBK8651944.1 protease complex subunit PrcB family protein [Elusimicrobiota bacterium]MBL0360563.1 protease complex subunit PrcB family protein [Elusimicrobiota bacterium]
MNDISNEQLSAYLDDALSPDDRAAVEKALANSPVLRGELAALKQTQAWVRALPSPTVPTGFEQRVLRVLQRPRARTNWWVIAPSAFGAVATAVLMVLVIHQESPRRKNFPTPSSTPPSSLGFADSEDLRFEKTPKRILKEKAERAMEPPREESKILENRVGARRTDVEAERIAPPALLDAAAGSVAQAKDDGAQSTTEGVALSGGIRRAAPVSTKEFGARARGGSMSDKDIGRDRAVSAAPNLKKSAFALPDMRGDDSGVAEFREVAVRSEEAWRRLWAEHAANRVPPPPAPSIDFAESMVVGIFLGTRPSGGYAVDILSVAPAGPGWVVIHREIRPAADSMQITVLTQPYHLRVVPRRDGPVRFIKK